MGQKVHPKGFRIGTGFAWSSRWFADSRAYKDLLLEDIKLRKALFKKLKTSGLAQVHLERSINKMKITLHVSRPGVVIGRGGSGLEELKKYITKFLADMRKHEKRKAAARPDGTQEVGQQGKMHIELSVEPVKEPNLSAYLVAQSIADQLVRRMPHKRVCNQSVDRVMAAGAKGVKILLSGRIRGAEIARKEQFSSGVMPLSTIREDIDYAIVPALTKSGYIGVKVWICRKEQVN